MTIVAIPRSTALSAKVVAPSDFEKYFRDFVDEYVITGLTLTNGGGLTLNIGTGECRINGVHVEVTVAETRALTDAATNHIYIQLSRDGSSEVQSASVTHNTTGSAPADSIKLGTATTSGGAITAIDTTSASGRQTKSGIKNSEITTLGLQDVPVPAAAMVNTTTSGAAAIATYESATNKNNYRVYDFDASTNERVEFTYPMPRQWNEGTIKVKILWTAASGSGDVKWGVSAVAISNDDTLDVAYGSEVTVTDTLLAANDLHDTGLTSAITVGGTPQAGDLVQIRIERKASDGADTLAVDARLLGAVIELTTDSGTSA